MLKEKNRDKIRTIIVTLLFIIKIVATHMDLVVFKLNAFIIIKQRMHIKIRRTACISRLLGDLFGRGKKALLNTF